MLLSRGCQYAIRALLHLNGEVPERYVSVRTIAEDCDISPSFLSKVLGVLVTHGLLDSLKGPGGGVRLRRKAGEITLLDVVEATDGLKALSDCVLGFPDCGIDSPCPIHEEWEPVRARMVDLLAAKNLDDIAHDLPELTVTKRMRRKKRKT